MGKAKYYVAVLAFMLLNAVKLMYPQTPQQLRESVGKYFRSDIDYAGTVSAMGRELYSRGIIETLSLSLEGASDTISAAALTEDEAVSAESENPTQTVETTAPVESEYRAESGAEETPTPETTAVPEAVSAFLESQKAFEGCEIPDNVDADMHVLPFSYTSPVYGAGSSGFGYRVHPIYDSVKFHYGTDLAADSGESVLAFADGVATAAGVSDSYGNYLIIDHGQGYSSLYAHLSDFAVREGDEVKKGQLIGFVGSTGLATGPHLHFELRCGDKYLNPEYYL